MGGSQQSLDCATQNEYQTSTVENLWGTQNNSLTALRRLGLNMEKCAKTGTSRQFLLGTSYVTGKGVSIYRLVYIRLYYAPMRPKKGGGSYTTFIGSL